MMRLWCMHRTVRQTTVTKTLTGVTPLLWCALRACSGTTITTNSNDTKGHVSSASMGRGNYFAFFNLPKHPVLDVAALQKTYHGLQRRAHPDQQRVQANDNDKGGSDDNAVVSSSTDVSAYANGAYETLRSPFERCRYLDRLIRAERRNHGEPLTVAQEEQLVLGDGDAAAQHDITGSKADGGEEEGEHDLNAFSESFYQEMMAMNELIFCGDIGDKAVQDRMRVLLADLQEREETYYEHAQQLWEKADYDGFHHLLQEWVYIHRALHNLRQRW